MKSIRVAFVFAALLHTPMSWAMIVIVQPATEVAVPTSLYNAVVNLKVDNKAITTSQQEELLGNLASSQADINCRTIVKCAGHFCTRAVPGSIATQKSTDESATYRKANGAGIALKDVYIDGKPTDPPGSIHLNFESYQCTDDKDAAVVESVQELCDINRELGAQGKPKDDCSNAPATAPLKSQPKSEAERQSDESDKLSWQKLNKTLRSGFCYASDLAMETCLAYLSSSPMLPDFDHFLLNYLTSQFKNSEAYKNMAPDQRYEEVEKLVLSSLAVYRDIHSTRSNLEVSQYPDLTSFAPARRLRMLANQLMGAHPTEIQSGITPHPTGFTDPEKKQRVKPSRDDSDSINSEPIEAIKNDNYLPLNEANCKLDPDPEKRFLLLSKLVTDWSLKAKELAGRGNSRLSKLDRTTHLSIIGGLGYLIKGAMRRSKTSFLADSTILICNPNQEVMAIANVGYLDHCLYLNYLATSPSNFESNGKRKPDARGAGREALIALVKRSLNDPETRGCVSGVTANSAETFYTQFTKNSPRFVWRVEKTELNEAFKKLLALRSIQTNSPQSKY